MSKTQTHALILCGFDTGILRELDCTWTWAFTAPFQISIYGTISDIGEIMTFELLPRQSVLPSPQSHPPFRIMSEPQPSSPMVTGCRRPRPQSVYTVWGASWWVGFPTTKNAWPILLGTPWKRCWEIMCHLWKFPQDPVTWSQKLKWNGENSSSQSGSMDIPALSKNIPINNETFSSVEQKQDGCWMQTLGLCHHYRCSRSVTVSQ